MVKKVKVHTRLADEEGDQVLYLFEEEDDAIRFAMMLEESEHPPMTCA